jgi:hypothetical protein
MRCLFPVLRHNYSSYGEKAEKQAGSRYNSNWHGVAIPIFK